MNYNQRPFYSPSTQGINWRNPDHWACNDQVHPSRLGTYDGISQLPHETVFVKVGNPPAALALTGLL